MTAQYPAILAQHLEQLDEERTDLNDPLIRAKATKGDECDGAQYHSPRPLFLVETPIVPLGWVAHDVEVPVVQLCGTCQDNLSVYQALLFQLGGEVSWSIRREFGNMIRALGDRGWKFYQEVSNG